MGRIFIKSARANVAGDGGPLTVLAHSEGVELLHLTCTTPIAVRDVVAGDDIPLWDRTARPRARASAAAPDSVREVTSEQRRERDWAIGLVRAGVEARADHPEEKLLAIFDVFDEWFHRSDYEACTFVDVLLEMGKDHPLGRASVEHLTYIRGLVAGLAAEAGLSDPEEFAYSWHILMKGAIINAVEGDDDAARRAQSMGHDLIARYRRVADEVGDAAHQLDPRWAVG